jgi:hypothetical protein
MLIFLMIIVNLHALTYYKWKSEIYIGIQNNYKAIYYEEKHALW